MPSTPSRSPTSPLLLLHLGGAEQAPLAVDLAQAERARALAALRLVVQLDLPAGVLLPLEVAQHRDVAARPGLRILPAQGFVLLALGERLARGVEEKAQVLIVEALGGGVFQQSHPVLGGDRKSQRRQ